MNMPDFVARNGELTPDGQRLIAWIEAQFKDADKNNDLSRLNGLSGYLAYYYVNVHKLRAITPAQWLEEHRHSGAAAAWRDMLYFEEVARKEAEQQAAVVETRTELSGLAEQLEALRQELAEARQRITELEQQPRGRRGKRAEVTESEPVTEQIAEQSGDTDESTGQGADAAEQATEE